MIAHSLKGKTFGPAQKMHGATYVVDAIFKSNTLTKDNIVIDMALAHQILKEVLSTLNYQNLDEMANLKNQVTTTEFMAKYIHDELKNKVKKQFKGSLEIVLGESPFAWASYIGE